MDVEDLVLGRLPKRDGHIVLGRVFLIQKLAKGGLVASPDAVAHRTTLHHLEEVLGVRVFHRIDEFLEFLGVEERTTRSVGHP